MGRQIQAEEKHKKEVWEDYLLVLHLATFNEEMSRSTISISGILIPYQNIKFKTILEGNRKQWESLWLLSFKTMLKLELMPS